MFGFGFGFRFGFGFGFGHLHCVTHIGFRNLYFLTVGRWGIAENGITIGIGGLINLGKSGFYWHFRERRDLLSQVLDYWAYEYTEVVTQNQELNRVDPKSRLNLIASMIREHNLPKFDLSIRAWAAHDEMAAEMMAKVYRKRLGFLRETFRELGFKGDELEMRTHLFVTTVGR